MTLFGYRRLLPVDEAEWIAGQCAGFVDRFGPGWRDSRRLILPSREFFDAPKGSDHGVALIVFDQIKRHMGLGEDWPVRLEAQEPAPRVQAVAETLLVQHDTRPILGSFRVDEQGPLITYDPDLPGNPRAFIATMAHELAHYMLLATTGPNDRYDDPGLEEIATDLLVVEAGFGVMSLESAFTSEAFGDAFAQGWRVSHRGYISPETIAFALGLFLRRYQIEAKEAQTLLSPINAKRLKRALRQIDADPSLIWPEEEIERVAP